MLFPRSNGHFKYVVFYCSLAYAFAHTSVLFLLNHTLVLFVCFVLLSLLAFSAIWYSRFPVTWSMVLRCHCTSWTIPHLHHVVSYPSSHSTLSHISNVFKCAVNVSKCCFCLSPPWWTDKNWLAILLNQQNFPWCLCMIKVVLWGWWREAFLWPPKWCIRE